ncbi:MAG: acetyl-CoA carboxylase carboxyltransferase subunit alpha [Planctomycetota bacterium]
MSSHYSLDFEQPLRTLEEEIAQLRTRVAALAPAATPDEAGPSAAELAEAEHALADRVARHSETLAELYRELTPWNTVRVARHPKRPQGRDYIEAICRDFTELHGDRRSGEDPAIVTGFGRIGDFKCMVVAHHKGRDTQEKLRCHFGCPNPEGYRKALHKMQLAAKFGVPIVTLVDTPGAFPGIEAEQRGQAEAIAFNLREMSRLPVPIVSVVIGEGGSGGALGIAVADRVAMLQHAWYSVISPEGCAAILWKQANERTNSQAATALRLTARDNLELGVVDAVIDEPVGGAHRDKVDAAGRLERWVVSELRELTSRPSERLLEDRYRRFRRLGAFEEVPPEAEPPEAGPAEGASDQDTNRNGGGSAAARA